MTTDHLAGRVAAGAAGAWRRFWFARVRRHPLGLLRIAVAAWSTYRYLPNLVEEMTLDHAMDEALYAWNVGSRLVVLPYPPSGPGLVAYEWLLLSSGILATIGLFTRASLAVFGAALLYGFSGVASHSIFNHEQVLTVQVLLVLAVAPGARAWSLDRLVELIRFSRRSGGPRQAGPEVRPTIRRWLRHLQGPPVERWGLQLLFVLLAVVYCTAGISKVRFSEGRWFDGEALGYYLSGQQAEELDTHGQIFFGDPELADAYGWKDGAALVDHAYGYTVNPDAGVIAEHGSVMAVLASATIVFELLGVVLLLGRPWRDPYLLGAFGMHSAIGWSMHLHFTDYRLILLCLVDWWGLLSLARRVTWRWTGGRLGPDPGLSGS